MRWLKVGAVIFGAVIITALSIDAADTLTGKSGTMLGQLVSSEKGVCPKGMVEVPVATSFTCIDKYEASAGEDCSVSEPKAGSDTEKNMSEMSCGSDSVPDVLPWRFITREQAVTVCARAGKRLPKSAEWYEAALGSVDNNTNCNIDSTGPKPSGSSEECVSTYGVNDMVGNVWEWVGDDVIDGKLNGRNLPKEGYVAQVDGGGVATLTSESPSNLFSADYFWSSETGAFGMLRGGYYGSQSDAGIYAVHNKTVPTTVGTAIGFRCVQ